MAQSNKAFVFKQVPKGMPKAGVDVVVEDRPLQSTEPPQNGIFVKNFYASFDPYQRGRMRAPEIKSYAPPYTLNEPIANSTVGKVLKSNNSRFKEGDLVQNWQAGPTEEYTIFDESSLGKISVLDNKFGLNPAYFIGALGMPGLTAWSSLYEIGQPKKGETIFISAASGAVGQLVGQLAKMEGLTVVGSVGDDEKKDYILKELGFDAAFNYKKDKPEDTLRKLAPQGIDIYYENVGGEHLEAAIRNMNNFGRIIACGMVSQYNLAPKEHYPIRDMMSFVAKRLKMQGFIVNDPNMGPLYAKEHQEKLQQWIHEGKFKVKMSTTKGIENAPAGFVGMLNGENFGKAVLEIASHES